MISWRQQIERSITERNGSSLSASTSPKSIPQRLTLKRNNSAYKMRSAFEEYARTMIVEKSIGKVSTEHFLASYRHYERPKSLFIIWLKIFAHERIRDSSSLKVQKAYDFLSTWITLYFPADFKGKIFMSELIKTISSFEPTQKQRFQLLLIKAKNGAPQQVTNSLSYTSRTFNMKASFLELDNTMVAHVLTNVESQLLRKITPREFCNNSWQKEEKEKKAPNITKLINHFNKIAYWVATEILTKKDPREQLATIEKFIKLARTCEEMSNYNTCMEIISGLNNTAVQRLKEIWESLADKHRHTFTSLERLFQAKQNFKPYREEIKKKQGNVLPYFGIFLRDVTFSTVANPLYLTTYQPNPDLIQILGDLMEEVRHYQLQSFNLTMDATCDFYITHINHLDDESLYQLSLKQKPPSGSPVNSLSAIKDGRLLTKSRSLVVISKDVSKTTSGIKIKGTGSEFRTFSRKPSFRRKPVPTVSEEEDYLSD